MKTAIVTGAASGLGRAIALRYAQKGWQVVCSDLRGGAPAGESLSTVDAIKKLNVGRAAFVRADVSKEEDVKNLVSSAVSLFGRLDVMVNNAGIALESHNNLGPKLGADTAFSTFNQTMAVNLGGVFLGSKYAIQQFLKQDLLPGNHRGWIVNTASVYGLKPEIGHVSYCAAKAGVVQLTKCLAREYGPSKIHVNAICPGFIKTAMDSELYNDEAQNAQAKALHPWGELGTPDDIGKAAVWLASEESAWVTGVALPVDGGYMTA